MPAARSSRVASRICSTRVPFSMASRTFCDRTRRRATRSAARPAERIDVAVAQEQVGPAQARGGAGVALLDQLREAQQPARLQPQDVIGEPDVSQGDRPPEGRPARRRRCRGSGRGSAGPRSAWHTSCSGTGSRGWLPRSARSSRGAAARSRGSVRCPRGPAGNRSESRSRRSGAAASARGRHRRSPVREARDRVQVAARPPRSRSTSSASVSSPSPRSTKSAPRATYSSSWSVASEPQTITAHPRARAAASMVNAASRMRSRHIFER